MSASGSDAVLNLGGYYSGEEGVDILICFNFLTRSLEVLVDLFVFIDVVLDLEVLIISRIRLVVNQRLALMEIFTVDYFACMFVIRFR